MQKTFETYIAQARKYNYVVYTNSEDYRDRLLKYYPDIKVELVHLDKLVRESNSKNLLDITKDELQKYYPYPEEGKYFGFYDSDWLKSILKKDKKDG